ncbi:MAG TPA: Spy/CpxP family protein refolding chaperone [Phenylobacterium sp.]|nr:Spy/CpxP family protein refolding chaperone [Phenylobacterium sp.]
MNLLRPLVLSASILILGAAGVAQAQPASPPPGAMSGVRDAGPHGKMGGGMGHERHDPAAMATHLRAALQLTPAQEPALNAFVAAMKPPEGMRDQRRMERGEMATMTTPQRLDRMKARMDDHRARFEQHAAAVKRFYAQLTPAQQKAFDTLHAGHRGGHGMGGRGMGGPGMGHGMDHGPQG